MQGQRYGVEHTFEEGKHNCGMAGYQHRRWLKWYHHMALVMMALLVMLMEKMEDRNETPLLTTVKDITELLTFYLQTPLTEEEVFRRIEIDINNVDET